MKKIYLMNLYDVGKCKIMNFFHNLSRFKIAS